MTVLLAIAAPCAAEGELAEPTLLALSLPELMDLQVTEIATRTPLRVREAPGIVTVISGDEMRSAGLQSVLEALDEIPGVFVTPEAGIVMRGLGYVWYSGKIQYQLNGIPVGESLSQASAPLNVPIEMVEKIEVIRGPGSALYGKGAYLGVVNVVTRRDQNLLFAETGSFDAYRLGALLNIARPERQFSASLGIAYWRRNDRNSTIAQDVLYGTPFESYSEAPGVDNDAQEAPLTGVLDVRYRGIRLQAHVLTAHFADNLGISGALSPPSDGMARKHGTFLLEASWEGQLMPWFGNRFRLGYREYEWDNNEHLFPAGYLGLPTALRGGPHYEEHSLYGAIETYFNRSGPHEFLFGIELETIASGDTWQYFNYDPLTFRPVPEGSRFSGEQNWLDEDIERDILSLYVQDQISLPTGTRLTAGLRYDRYSDTGDRWAPRLALVHPLGDGHTLKAQYAEAFRPPTFVELYTQNNPVVQGNTRLTPEDIGTVEAGYLYTGDSLRWDLVLFRSRLNKMIDTADGVYANTVDATAWGGEISFDRHMGADLSLSGSLAYVDAREEETDEPLPGSINWLGDVRMNYRPTAERSITLTLHYLGKGNRAAGDTRRRADDSATFDIVLKEDNVISRGLTFTAGLANIFDEDNLRQSPTLPADVPAPGRTWWVRLTHHF